MGPVRHQQLIRLLAFVVAIDLCAGVVAISVRDGSTGSASTSVSATGRGDGNGILSAGRFTQRRESNGSSNGNTAPETAATAATRGGAPGTTNSTAPPATLSTSPAAAPATRPSMTSTTRAVTSSTGPTTTTSKRAPTTTATTPPSTGGTPGPSASGGGTDSVSNDRGTLNPTWVDVDDPAGDTVVDGTLKPKSEGRADLVQSRATYMKDAVLLTAKTAEAADPRKDPHWASESTFISWELDTNGDAVPDYIVQYGLRDGALVAGVSRPDDNEFDSVCEAGANYGLDTHAVGLDPACIKSPAAFSYRATILYDSDPKNENADVITDVAPNGGWSRPVARSES